MNIYVLLIISFILVLLVGNAFYVAFKGYEEDDDFTGGINTFSFVEMLLGGLLFISEKFFPERYHIAIFKFISFIFGVINLGLLILLWLYCSPFE
ncbi:hypothetical protein HMPREF1210_02846 [Paenisporosarcina sp. HGH0030]|uniref:hypothetical protein n=1 Tax=Paenisporosarcina sp. HGH0030 TaxID=1078085 RepID=UPI00034E417E|nr:hypothetical protein [Paenisporosarcina sp. HGH0030]EPD50275.1 hypothetical protein HMPREF1210_02846 [Paenisporosarcina sp. HGH0030]